MTYSRIDLVSWDGSEPAPLAPAIEHLRTGGLVATPTETVYGFSGLPEGRALERLLELKGRGPSRPVLLLIEDEAALLGLVWTDGARALADAFWPGPLTLVLADPGGRFAPGVRSDTGGVAVRRSGHPVVAALIRGTDSPLTSSSANPPGRPPAETGDEAAAAAADLGFAADEMIVLDRGRLPERPASTLVDATGPRLRLLREGAISLTTLLRIVPDLDV